MSHIRVLILQRGSRAHELTWAETNGSAQLQNWKEGSALWPRALLAGRTSPMDVFFCLDKEVLGQGFDPTILHQAVQNAHESMWAANVYVVVDKLWQPDDRDPEGPEPFDWLRSLFAERITDVLEWSIRPNSDYTEAAARSRQRMHALGRDPTHQPWRCFLQSPLTPEEERLLSPFLVNSLADITKGNTLVVLRPLSDNYLSYVSGILKRVRKRRVIIGMVDPLERLPTDLERLCQGRGFGLARFHGISEVYYFLEKLNGSAADAVMTAQRELFEAKLAFPISVKQQHFDLNRAQLLITHSYVAGKTEDCWLAAKDTWELIRDLPGDVHVRVYPAIKSAKLAGIVKELGHILAWIHIGHGDPQNALQQSGDYIFKNPEDWLSGFGGYKSSLALAMFSTCYSRDVARKFAAAGVCVTIGFKKEVHKKVCIEVTKRVVAAAIQSNGDRAAMLRAFSEGQNILVGEDPEAAPVAFWAIH